MKKPASANPRAPHYGRAVPTKFSRLEESTLSYLAELTELSHSELIRRAVYVLLRDLKKNGFENWPQYMAELQAQRKRDEANAAVMFEKFDEKGGDFEGWLNWWLRAKSPAAGTPHEAGRRRANSSLPEQRHAG